METVPAARNESGALAFEIENVYASPRAIARVLGGVEEVSEVSWRSRLRSSNDVRVEFKYQDRDYVVWEPFGDNNRYWIGPRNPAESAADIAKLEDAFKRYRPPLLRAVLGDLFTLKFLRRKKDG
jgi:hypothetical protein